MSYVTHVCTVEAWDHEGGLGPPGATLEAEQTWNFALYSRNTRSVTLLHRLD